MKIFENLYAFLWQSVSANNCNTYLIDGPSRILIDPGHLNMFDHVRKGLTELNLDIQDMELVICTHAHPDHTEGIQNFTNTSALTAIHVEELNLVKRMKNEMAALGMETDFIRPDFLLTEGDLSVKGLEFMVFHTPGHSPGSVSIYWPEHKALFTGDLIFKEGLGRTDLPGGNSEELKQSIQRLSTLDVEWILPGHGDIIKGSKEVKENFKNLEQFYFAYI